MKVLPSKTSTQARLVEFFDLIYGGQKGEIDIRYVLKEEGKKPVITGHPWCNYPTAEDKVLNPHNPKDVPFDRHIYLGMALRKDRSSGKKANCLDTPLLWVDVDLKDNPKYTKGKKDLLKCTTDELTEYKNELINDWLVELPKLGLVPRCVVDSGHGLHFYFVRQAATNAEDTERFNKRLAHLMKGEISGVNGIQATLRLPFSRNIKTRKIVVWTDILYTNPDAIVEDEALEKLEDPPKKEKKASQQSKIFEQHRQILAETNQSAVEKYAMNALEMECEAVANAPDGQRNIQLNTSSFSLGTLIGAGVLDEQYAANSLIGAAEHAGLEIGEIEATMSSGMEAGKSEPRDMSGVGQKVKKKRENIPFTSGKKPSKPEGEKPPAQPDDKLKLKDMADIAFAGMQKHGTYKYHDEWQSWWLYDSGVYKQVSDEKIKLKIYKDLLKSDIYLSVSQNKNVRGILEARHDKEGMTEQTDYELNCLNGIVDLENNCAFREHDKDWFSIAQSSAIYEEGVISHDWLKFLFEAVPNEKNRLILQQFAGLCLTADSRTQKSLMLIGRGGTGKGTFVDVLNAVLGELSTSSSIEKLKDGSFSIGSLVGKRLCIVSELPQIFCWMTFKRIVGEDRVIVDVKHKTPFLAKFGAKIIMLANNAPSFGEDSANNSLSRRIMPIKFDNLSKSPDAFLKDKLTTPENLSGVLNWMIEGLKSLRENNMKFPDQTKDDLMRELVEESNKIITFLQTCCEIEKDGLTKGRDLYAAYRAWAKENGYPPVGNNKFAKQLLSAADVLDFELSKTRRSKGVEWTGIVLDAEWTQQGPFF